MKKIFVTYSREDTELVTPIVTMIRGITPKKKSWVFQDINSIPAGTRWRKQIDKAIRAADVILVFWCRHSAISEEAGRERARALELNKKIMPVILDDTPLPTVLSEFQEVNFRYLAKVLHPKVQGGVLITGPQVIIYAMVAKVEEIYNKLPLVKMGRHAQLRIAQRLLARKIRAELRRRLEKT